MDAPDANRFDPSDSPFAGDDQETRFGPASPGAQASAASNPPSSPGLKGLNRIGKYEVRGELGSGGMGVVLRAHDPVLDRLVAIKVLRAPGFAGGEQLARFELEARSTARLQHPAIVSLHEVGSHEDMPFLVMDLIEGESLQAALMRAPLAPRRAAEIARVIADGLSHAHEHGIIHRDMKPHNILIHNDGRAFLTDFGLALDTTLHQQLTATGELVGTPAYMAPEQVDSEWGLICETTDVYGLGVVLYSSMTGEQPHSATTPMALLRKVLFNEVTPPRQLVPSIHPDLETITLRCMEKRPLERYNTAAEVHAELKRFLQGEAIVARPLTHSQRWWRWTRRHRALSITLALLAAALLTIAFSLVKQQRDLATQALTVRREERLRTLVASRSEASEARRLFNELNVAAVDNPGTHDDEAIGRGLGALEANLRLVSLLDDATDTLAAEELQRVKETSAMTALSLARLAQGSGQWAVAQNALDRALPLGVRTQELAAAQTSLDQARTRVARERREAVQAVLDSTLAGELGLPRQKRAGSPFQGNYQDALFTLLSYRDSDTVETLCQALDSVSAQLRQVIREVYTEAIDTSDNPAIREDLQATVDVWLDQLHGGGTDKQTHEKLSHATLLLIRYDESISADMQFHQRDLDSILGNRQSSKLTTGEISLARLCAEALGGHLQNSESSHSAILRYLQAEWSETRSMTAARALLRLRGEAALPDLKQLTQKRYRTGGSLSHLLSDYGSASVSSQDFDGLVRLAQMRIASKKVEQSLAAVEAALAIKPQDRGARAIRALIGIYTHEEAAQGQLEEILARPADDPVTRHCHATYLYEVGRAHMDQGYTADADTFFQRARDLCNSNLDENSRHLPSILLRGLISFEQRDWPSAIEAFTYAIRLDPFCAEAYAGRALTHKQTSALSASHEDSNRALDLDPDREDLWWNRGNVRYVIGDFAGAVEDHSAAIERKPDFVMAWINRGNAWLQAGDYQAALADLTHALDLSPDNPLVLSSRGSLYLDMARETLDPQLAMAHRRDSITDLERLTQLQPERAVSWFLLGNAYVASNRRADARRAYQRCLHLKAQSHLANRAKAWLDRNPAESNNN